MDYSITIYRNIKDTTSGYNRKLKPLLGRIYRGASEKQITTIRQEQDQAKRQQLKQDLPAICFSGTFRQRNDKGLVSHSGLVCLDFDKFPSTQALNKWREQLKGDPYTFCLFTSPSGDGLKVLVKIPPEPENHKGYFDRLEQYYDCEYFDTSCSNLSRVCYESHDPDIYYNEKALEWTELVEEEPVDMGDDNPALVLTSENRIIQNLLKWYDKLSTAKGNRNNNIFKLCAAFNEFGINRTEAENTVKGFAELGFTENEIEKIVNSAYKNTASHGTKHFEDHLGREKIEKQIRAGDTLKKIAKNYPDKTAEQIESAITTIKDTMEVTEFWYYNDKGRINIKPIKYKHYLEQQGHYKLYPVEGQGYIFIIVDGNLVDNITAPEVKDKILNYLETNPDFGDGPFNFMANMPKYFKEDYLSLIGTKTINFKKDTKKSCYLYYKNKAIKITKDTITPIDYLDMKDSYIWSKHIIERDYKEAPHEGCIYEQFVMLIAGNDKERYNSFRSVIGYMLHSHKTSADNRAIILNDEQISEHPNGGSGKGIFCSAIGYIKRMCSLDGKQFDFNKSFNYQTVGADTQVLVFDDVKRNFAFENLFSLVTEGITLEKKNKDAIRLPIQQSPKIIITTNYTIGGVGASFERRKFELELSSHFNVDHTPQDEFDDQMMFEDWDKDQWTMFDNFMIECLQYYLTSGLVSHQYKNLEVRKFIKATSFEFYEWCNEGMIDTDININRSEAYIKFKEEYSDMAKWLTQKRFSGWIEEYGRFKGYEIRKGKSGFRWIMLLENGQATEVIPDEEVPF